VLAERQADRHAEALRPLAERYGVTLPPEPVEDDDQWEQKLDLLRHDPVPVVSFTFGIPSHQVIAALKSHGSVVAQTVTNAAEARAAAAYLAPREWSRRALFNIGRSSRFSSDATIRQYASEIWGIPPCRVSESLVSDSF